MVASCDGTSDHPKSKPGPSASRAVAADGSNLTACSDGNCEVLVRTPARIALTGQGDVTSLSLETLDAKGLHFTVTSTGGGTSTASIQHGCTLSFYEGGGGSSCTAGGAQNAPSPRTGVLAVQLPWQGRDTAILRLVAGPPGPPPTDLVPPIFH
jgi:hypothetical protein